MASTGPPPSPTPRLSPREALTPDAEAIGWLRLLPRRARGYARLARLDRPAGSWLLFWPCAAGVALAGGLVADWPLIPWFLLGSLAMRAAGCVWNDIIDRKLDAQVARTRDRPVASGEISVRAALVFAIALSLAGLLVVAQLRPLAQLVAVSSLILVAAYPFMKRITWWPQAWLGLTFNWGVLVGWTAITEPGWPMALLYAAGLCWTLGYDTIYALQDLEDDAMAGIKSSARALGSQARAGVAVFYTGSVLALGAALWFALPSPLSPVAAVPFALHCCWQVWALKDHDPVRALALFRANRQAGLLLFAACAVVGLA